MAKGRFLITFRERLFYRLGAVFFFHSRYKMAKKGRFEVIKKVRLHAPRIESKKGLKWQKESYQRVRLFAPRIESNRPSLVIYFYA